MKRSARQHPDPIIRVDPPAGFARQMEAGGARHVAAYRMGRCAILMGQEPKGFQTSPIEIAGRAPLRWHLSISHPGRYPNWDEIAEARDKLLPADLAFVMLLPAAWDTYVNVHPNCFHLWECHDRDG